MISIGGKKYEAIKLEKKNYYQVTISSIFVFLQLKIVMSLRVYYIMYFNFQPNHKDNCFASQ